MIMVGLIVDCGFLEVLVGQSEFDLWELCFCFVVLYVVMKLGYVEVKYGVQSLGDVEEIVEWVDWNVIGMICCCLDGFGFGIVEVMDMVQCFDFGWVLVWCFIEFCGEFLLMLLWVVGVGFDQMVIDFFVDFVDVVVEQVQFIQLQGGFVVLLLQVWFVGCGEEMMVDFYCLVVEQVEGFLIVYWFGEMFVLQLVGYFLGDLFCRVLEIDFGKICGVKIFLFDV